MGPVIVCVVVVPAAAIYSTRVLARAYHTGTMEGLLL